MNNININTVNESPESYVHETLDEKIAETESCELNTVDILKNITIKNKKGLVIAYLNMNSIRNKIERLKLMVSKYVDILTIAEIEIDENFTTSQFMIEGFGEPFRKDRNKNGGGLLTYAREGILVKVLTNYKFPNDIEICITEIKLRTKNGYYLAYIAHPPNAQAISLKISKKESISSATNLKILSLWAIPIGKWEIAQSRLSWTLIN